MVSNNIEIVKCPKCAASNEDVYKFDHDVYIVRDNDDFVRRKLYGCNKCKNLFTYDATPRKEVKNIEIRNIFSNIAKRCDSAISNVAVKR